MNLEQTMTELEGLGTAQNRKVYRRHGAGDEQFGVSFANLRKLQKKIKKDQELAEALWATGNVDARTLATMIADPEGCTDDLLEGWAGDVEYYLLGDMLADLVARGPRARAKAEKWIEDDREFVAQMGWDLIARLAMKENGLDDDYFRPLLERIEREIHDAENRVRHAMNGALIAIGGSRPALETDAIAAAGRIGKVEVDHGETSCKTPAAIPYIRKMVARRKKKQAKGKKS